MIPKRVVLENFLSFGPKTEIEFTDDEPLWVLGGANGVGKSAVFDAITFCLFGAHRGGAKEIDPLVRHGANGFSVTFEFEFGGVDYRITRNRVGARTTQAVEQRKADAAKWERVPNINSVPQVREWAERTLGLGFDAFKASVLLRQGEADAIITAGGTDRLKILKKIIGAERFEELSKRVHDATRGKDAELERLHRQRDTTPAIAEEQLEAAKVAVEGAGNDRTQAEAARQSAIDCVGQAKGYAELALKRGELRGKIDAADGRAAAAVAIRRNKDRLDELNKALPTLAVLVPLRISVGEQARHLDQVRESHARNVTKQESLSNLCEGLRLRIATHRGNAADHSTKASTLRSTIEQQSKFLTAAEEVAALDAREKQFDPRLDQHAAEAEQAHSREVEAERLASAAVTEFDTLLKQSRKEQKQFDTVEVGVKCSRCGQKVTAEHADNERTRIADAIADLTRTHAAAVKQATDAKAARDAADARKKKLALLVSERNGIRQRLADQRTNLEALGGTSDVTRLRELIDRMTGEAGAFEQQRDAERDAQQAAEDELRDAGTELKVIAAECETQAAKVTALNNRFLADSAKLDALGVQLPEPWPETTAEQLAAYTTERDGLRASGIDEQFRQLLEDAALRAEWDQQLRAAMTDLERIPEAARILVADAERAAAAARTAFELADKRWQEARDRDAELARQAEQFARLKQEIAAAEAVARIHGKLDDRLGKAGLQRELVRDAETRIVGYARTILHNLSDGDLAIELDPADEGGDEAFALRVRRGDDPTPIGVPYLSGSQKFRVAISVALAIGRFAAGQARPLDCVIIDEGFGSLDKDGLKAAAEELNRLKQYLRRIVLVSHQTEFTDYFPVMIRLSKGEAGTTAEKVRR